uniref:hypothetical protein n=1 Tax=Arctium tomentosum TaxID=4218 RepID=UPI001D0FE762|nr:hypothetical protein LK293_mgp004 [Arctium tomentosum]YP_010194894.1 hypothetical protein LK294_mgp004 [Arctium lappa]QZZ81503.1 hypothetical protein [Arctium tomentosum]QZZ81633.1 hypothetical protein [Arctium lappa]
MKMMYARIDLNGSLAQRRRIGRDDRIGTREIFDPKQRRYQAALHPFQLVYSVIVENPCPVFHIGNAPPSIFNLSCHFFFFVFIDLYTHHHPADPTNAFLLIL